MKSIEDSLENISELLGAIESVSSRTAKMHLLSSFEDSEALKVVLFYTYNPYYVYGIDKAAMNVSVLNDKSSDKTLIELLDFLRSKNVNSSDKVELQRYLNKVESEFGGYVKSWVVKIILKDLKIGVNIETINKVFPKLIPTFKVSLCEPYKESAIDKRKMYLCEPKLDGARILSICTATAVILMTRNGNMVDNYADVERELKELAEKNGDIVFDGEIVSETFDETMESLFALKKDKQAVYTIFDVMTLKEFNERRCASCQSARTENLNSLIGLSGMKFVKPIKSTTISGKDLIESIQLINYDAVSEGYEGLIVKDCDANYSFKRSFSWMKYKSMLEQDFVITGFVEGTGKYEGSLGAIKVKSIDESIESEVGSGFSDTQRQLIFNNPEDFIGKICTVKYQELTRHNSLRFPVFLKIRNDL